MTDTTTPWQMDVPIPRAKTGRKRSVVWDMPVGGSIFLKSSAGAAIARRIKAETGRGFTTRAVIEGGVKGMRLWRIK